jgi:hypothetical protein
MATNFPGGIDTFVNPNATSSLDSPSHAGLHTDLADGMTAVQTQLVNSPYGLVHINTTSFTSSSSESFNNVFSATYDNYKILLKNVMGSSVENHFRLRANGVDNTSNIYTTQRLTANNTTINGARTAAGGFALLGASETLGTSFVIELFDPFNTRISQIQCMSNSDGHLFEAKFSRINSSSSFDGFTIFPASSTFTGQISIYGYRKS